MWDDISLIIALVDIPGPQRTPSGCLTAPVATDTVKPASRPVSAPGVVPAAVEQYKLVLCRPEAFRMLYRPWTAKTAKDKKELKQLQEMLGYVYCFDMPWHAQYKARLAQGDNNDGKKESDFGQD